MPEPCQRCAAGKLREAERDRIEEEVGAYVRTCSANIDKLQARKSSSRAGSVYVCVSKGEGGVRVKGVEVGVVRELLRGLLSWGNRTGRQLPPHGFCAGRGRA